ncbi:hypothetical protein [Xanthomonas campestris]|uniref:Uncharacterized protein n=1 Tax=Xanthomonas campestris pv. papavericola TaxID=487881 RepID=A0AAJ2X1G4_XANCA|nr:hypothetical protein [Xanthomonas campestris]MEC3887159.1 hypothetical protein [Xanthomonas campestris pv. papavericola]
MIRKSSVVQEHTNSVATAIKLPGIRHAIRLNRFAPGDMNSLRDICWQSAPAFQCPDFFRTIGRVEQTHKGSAGTQLHGSQEHPSLTPMQTSRPRQRV